MLRKFFLSALVGLVSLSVYSQSIDEKIGNAMNASDWFALDSIYSAAPKDSIHPFLEVYSRCLLGNRFNRPDLSIPAFQELFSTQSQHLDLGNLIQSTYLFGMDLSRVGRNAEAASYTEAVINSAKQYLDSAIIARLNMIANRYAALAHYNLYRIAMPQSNVATIPFTIVPVGPADKGSVHMHLTESAINGISADITFDTGAGANIISAEMAEKFNLTPLDSANVNVVGMAHTAGNIAIAKELRLGDIMVYDVPFVVMQLTSHNEEADQYFETFNIVVGSELMLQLKDLTIDFINRNITIPTEVSSRTEEKPNICFSPTMNLLAKGSILGCKMLICLDSGDAGFGAVGERFYKTNKEWVDNCGRLDSIRSAGIAGTAVERCYYISDIPVSIGGVTVKPSEFVVKTDAPATIEDYDARIGLRTLMLFGKIRFNMVDFDISVQKPNLQSAIMPNRSLPSFKFTYERPTFLQTVGLIGMSVANGLLNHNAPTAPDL